MAFPPTTATVGGTDSKTSLRDALVGGDVDGEESVL